MNWERVERRLQRGFSGRPTRFGSTVLVERRRPFPLAEVIEEALSEDEREGYGGLEAWPGNVSELLKQNGIEERQLLGFYWDALGPMSWSAGLVLVGNGRKRYLAFWDEIESYRAVAVLEPWDDELAVSAATARLLARNGTGFGLGLFGSLPTETTNYAPELVACEVVRRAYFDLMQWWERERGSAWLDLAEEHFGRMVEPNHLQRSLDILESLPQLDEPDALDRWLDARDAESAAIPDTARDQLFDDWFNGAYDEPDRQIAAEREGH